MDAIREIGRKTPLPSQSTARTEKTQRPSTLPAMEHMVQALKELSSRQALLQTAMRREDEGHSRVLKVHHILRGIRLSPPATPPTMTLKVQRASSFHPSSRSRTPRRGALPRYFEPARRSQRHKLARRERRGPTGGRFGGGERGESNFKSLRPPATR
jgi:hypothetical protein